MIGAHYFVIMTIRRIFRIDKAGNFKRLKQVKEKLADPAPGEVQIDIMAIGLNFADIFAVLGLYGATPQGRFVPGLEYAGVISKKGTGVTAYEIGDRVMGVTRFGGYATHLNIGSEYITPIPEKWSFQEGAAFLVQALTAYYALFKLGHIKANDTVLIHSAAGGVGLQANRMARCVGAYTIGTVGTANKVPLLEREGYKDYLVRGSDFKKHLEKKLKGRELNIVMECIGGKVLKAGYDLLAPQGRMICYGSARYGSRRDTPNWLRLAWLYLTRPKIDPQKMIESNKAVLGFNLIWLYEKKELLAEILHEMQQLDLPAPFIGHEFDFDALKEALRFFQTGKSTGKIVINVQN